MSEMKEMTRYAFISHMEDYMKKLLSDPLKADTDDFLKSYNIDGPKAISILTKKTDPNDENSAVIIKTTAIKDNGVDEEGNKKKDSFVVRYKIPRKDYTRKMRNLFINLFESNEIEGSPLNEDGEGATSAASSGAFVAPAFGPIVRKTMYITEEQAEYIKEATVANGSYVYDAPISRGNEGNYFYKEANDHQKMMEKSWPKK